MKIFTSELMINMGVVLMNVSFEGSDIVAFDILEFGYLIVVGDESFNAFASVNLTAMASVAMNDAGHVGGEEINDAVMGL